VESGSEVHNRQKEVIINEWLSETTDTVMKYVVVERIDGTPFRSQLCSTIEEATRLQQQWQQ
jgi:hypothetical protein